jgi:hypothetical protein
MGTTRITRMTARLPAITGPDGSTAACFSASARGTDLAGVADFMDVATVMGTVEVVTGTDVAATAMVGAATDTALADMPVHEVDMVDVPDIVAAEDLVTVADGLAAR